MTWKKKGRQKAWGKQWNSDNKSCLGCNKKREKRGIKELIEKFILKKGRMRLIVTYFGKKNKISHYILKKTLHELPLNKSKKSRESLWFSISCRKLHSHKSSKYQRESVDFTSFLPGNSASDSRRLFWKRRLLFGAILRRGSPLERGRERTAWKGWKRLLSVAFLVIGY